MTKYVKWGINKNYCKECLSITCDSIKGLICNTEKCGICNSVLCPKFNGPKRCHYINCTVCGYISYLSCLATQITCM
jgi:hypothetical protein